MPTASESQMHRLLALHAAGHSAAEIAAAVQLPLKVVEAVVDSPLTQALRANQDAHEPSAEAENPQRG